MGFIVSLLVLSVLIFFHELGHFLAARFFGVRVEVFSIGFGKKLYSKTFGNTQWSLSAIPLGGYVKMKGQDDSDPTKKSYEKDSYTTKKPWQKIVILLAGPFANFLLAFILYVMIATIGVPKLTASIGKISENSPAYQAGLLVGDTVTAINGTKIRYWDELATHISEATSQIRLQIKREDKILFVTLAPQTIEDKNIFGEPIQRKIIGISPLGTQESAHFGIIGSLQYAADETKKASLLIVQSIQKLITGVVGADQIAGVIGIVDITAKATNAGIISLLFFTALISVNLGVLNLLPIPALDGGHIMFNLYEMVTRKAPSDT
ncbi:MAG TPA: RIP metalloprotease RseP, partial [Epsilonproteobacteria bacterium]|nr:RIP metalloprotease RseP [Campylobacterota bacterium]